jgi:hypothetical protein
MIQTPRKVRAVLQEGIGMRNLWIRCEDLWCEFMHAGILWPIHGEYRCRECLRTRAVPWES